MKRLLLLLPLLLVSIGGHASEVRTTVPEYRGQRASAPAPPEIHTRNHNAVTGDPLWGGCVPSSTRTAALYHRVPRHQVEAYWQLAQRRVGRAGTDPGLQAEMLRQTMPAEKYYSYLGSDPDRVLDALSRRGRLVCSTMNTGDQYGGREIHHWVDVAEYRSGGQACFIDNNDPGFYHWLPAAEFARRALDGDIAWLFCFTRESATVRIAVPLALVCLGLGALVIGLGAVISTRSVEVVP